MNVNENPNSKTSEVTDVTSTSDVKHDALFILGNGSKHNNQEIRISIASLLKYGKSWLNKIYVVGTDPKLKTDKIVYLHCYDKYTHSKDANIIHKIKFGIDNFPNLTEDFLVCSDDQLITRPTVWEDFKPRYFKKFDPKQKYFQSFKESQNKWKRNLYATLMRFWDDNKTVDENKVYFYQPHIFSPFNKAKFLELYTWLGDISTRRDLIIFSLYYNWVKYETPALNFDVLDCVSRPDLFLDVFYGKMKLPTHICYGDRAFEKAEFRGFLGQVLNRA